MSRVIALTQIHSLELYTSSRTDIKVRNIFILKHSFCRIDIHSFSLINFAGSVRVNFVRQLV